MQEAEGVQGQHHLRHDRQPDKKGHQSSRAQDVPPGGRAGQPPMAAQPQVPQSPHDGPMQKTSAEF